MFAILQVARDRRPAAGDDLRCLAVGRPGGHTMGAARRLALVFSTAVVSWRCCSAAPNWPVVVAPNGEVLATAMLRDRPIQLQVDTGSAVSWVAAEGCELRDLHPDTAEEVYFGQLHTRAALPPDAGVIEHADACDALAESGMRMQQLWVGARVLVQRSEALVAGCVGHRGKEWDSVREKRLPRLGTAATVRKVENNAGKEAVKLKFESDGETMWWRPEFLQPAHAFAADASGRCSWRPEHEGDTAASECLGLHYADNTDVVGGCAVLNISYTSVRGGRAQAPAGLLFGLARLIQEEVHLSDGFDRQGLAWDGMLGLAPPHPKHRVFERRYMARARAGPAGLAGKKRASHSLVESILRSSEDSQSDGNAASTYTLELGPWPTGETGWDGASGWDEESAASVVGGVPGKLKLGVASGPVAAAAAATLAGAALGPVSVLPQANLDNKGTYWKVAATHLTLEVLEGTWLGGGWGEGGRHERELEEPAASSRVLRSIPVYEPTREISMHADTGCPAIAYPSDKVDVFEPFLSGMGMGERPEGTSLALSFRIANCNINGHLSSEFSIENAEIMWNCPRKMMIYIDKWPIILQLEVYSRTMAARASW